MHRILGTLNFHAHVKKNGNNKVASIYDIAYSSSIGEWWTTKPNTFWAVTVVFECKLEENSAKTRTTITVK